MTEIASYFGGEWDCLIRLLLPTFLPAGLGMLAVGWMRGKDVFRIRAMVWMYLWALSLMTILDMTGLLSIDWRYIGSFAGDGVRLDAKILAERRVSERDLVCFILFIPFGALLTPAFPILRWRTWQAAAASAGVAVLILCAKCVSGRYARVMDLAWQTAGAVAGYQIFRCVKSLLRAVRTEEKLVLDSIRRR